MNDMSMRASAPRPLADPEARDFDVLIVGAGISGIGAARQLLRKLPEKTFAILETKAAHGGTWRMHTYPGVRSDSDFYTFGYRDKPWNGAPIAKRAEILSYLDEAIDEDGLADHIRYDHKVLSANWSGERQRWELEVETGAAGKVETYSAKFLWMCQGYYDHETPHTPEWPGMDSFAGTLVHPQKWPDDLDCTGKTVVVIGSGATAATLVPSLAETAGHVTMLQRSPTYFHSGANQNELADRLRALEVPPEWIHDILRRAYLKDAKELQDLAAQDPEAARQFLMDEIRAQLGPDFDVETHFNPAYKPWQQRIAFVPDGDLFKAMKAGKASVVTDQIERFTTDGILLKSGKVLQADVIITATGFNMQFLSGIPFARDGVPVSFPDTVTYRGAMVSGLPNMAYMLGYVRTSWTMRVDLLADFICRLLAHADSKGKSVVTPVLGIEEAAMPRDRLFPESEFNAGYMNRGLHAWPRRINAEAWNLPMDYYHEAEALPQVDLDEPALVYA